MASFVRDMWSFILLPMKASKLLEFYMIQWIFHATLIRIIIFYRTTPQRRRLGISRPGFVCKHFAHNRWWYGQPFEPSWSKFSGWNSPTRSMGLFNICTCGIIPTPALLCVLIRVYWRMAGKKSEKSKNNRLSSFLMLLSIIFYGFRYYGIKGRARRHLALQVNWIFKFLPSRIQHWARTWRLLHWDWSW